MVLIGTFLLLDESKTFPLLVLTLNRIIENLVTYKAPRNRMINSGKIHIVTNFSVDLRVDLREQLKCKQHVNSQTCCNLVPSRKFCNG